MSKLKYNITHGKHIGEDENGKAIYINTKCGAIIQTKDNKLILVLDYIPTKGDLCFGIWEPKPKEEKELAL